jgi:hypothetical protein
MDKILGADTLGFGFDITKNYSEDSTTQQIFNQGKPDAATYTIGSKTYAVPENIGVDSKPESEGWSLVRSTRQEVQDHFSAKANVSGSGFGFKGQVEAAYSFVTKRTTSNYYGLVEATTHRYTLKLKEQRASWFTKDFGDDLAALPAKFNKETEDEFFAFFSTYGTHYVHQVKLGGNLYYYVSIDKSATEDERSAKAKLDFEYGGVFGKTKAEAESSWKQLSKEWMSSREVRVATKGGENNLSGLVPGFGVWKGDDFAAWGASLIEKPGLSNFNLLPMSSLVPLAKKTQTENALREYLRGGVVVRADRDSTPADPKRKYTAYPTIIGPAGVIAPPSAMPEPPRRDDDVSGVQVVLLHPETFQVIFNKAHYVNPDSDIRKNVAMWDALAADLAQVTARDFYCAVSVFGISPVFYPPNKVASFFNDCGAQMTEWQKYIGATSQGKGSICYTFAGRKGMRTGAKEEFIIDPERWLRKNNSTSLLFLHGAGVLRKALVS